MWKTVRKPLLVATWVFAIFLLLRPFTPLRSFSIPTMDVCIAAIGPLDGLPENTRRAFTPGSDFDLINPPKRADWLSMFPEGGQTFEEYRKERPAPIMETGKEISLLPIGDFPPGDTPDILKLADFTRAFFSCEVGLLPQEPVSRFEANRRINRTTGKPQLLSTEILDNLKKRLLPTSFCILGITMSDLYPDPAWNFVFGQASLDDWTGVFSFARYDPVFYGQPRNPESERLLLKRSCKILAHETGHIFGLFHCVYFQCLMNGSNHLAESDSRPFHLCPVCLRKLHQAHPFDIPSRYRKLRDFWKAEAFDTEVGWLEKRISFIEK